MTFRAPITKERLRDHFRYNFWKYLLLAALAVFGWNLLFTVTRYRVPEERKLDFYVDGISVSQEADAAMEGFMRGVHQEATPEMEEVSYVLLAQDGPYGDMQLSVWVAAGQGDLFLLQKQRFAHLAAGGALVDLGPFVESGALPVAGMNLAAGKARNEADGQLAQYGIPADSLQGLGACGALVKGGVLCVRTGVNEDAALRAMAYLLTHAQALPKEGETP